MKVVISKENKKVWYSRTDGKSICSDCIYKFWRDIYFEDCILGKKDSTSCHKTSCNFYKKNE